MTSTPSNQDHSPADSSPASDSADAGAVRAGPGRYYRNTRYLMAIVFIAMGAWFGYDGFVRWPGWNQMYDKLEAQRQVALDRGDRQAAEQLRVEQGKYEKHNEASLMLQKVLCFALPPLGLILLARALRNSRGEYRLEGTTLHVPGHPPVPFENITQIDRRRWDRKGIAYIHYDLGDGRQGRLRLDDFHYERPPTDAIFDRIQKYVAHAEPAPTAPPDASAGN